MPRIGVAHFIVIAVCNSKAENRKEDTRLSCVLGSVHGKTVEGDQVSYSNVLRVLEGVAR